MGNDGLLTGLMIVIGIVTLLGIFAIAAAAFPAFRRSAKAKSLDLATSPPHVQSKLLEAFDASSFDDFVRESSRRLVRTYKLTNQRDFEVERERSGRVSTAIFLLSYRGQEREAHIHLNAQGIPVGINLPRANAS